MSKNISQYLQENQEFLDIWADYYSSPGDMVERFKDEFNMENFDGDFESEVYVACNQLDSGMRQLFLKLRES